MELPKTPLQTHLDALYSDTLNYLQNENDPVLRGEQPEPLSILRMMRNFNMRPFAGGLFDQPFILLRELQTVIEAEATVLNQQSQDEIDEMRQQLEALQQQRTP